MNNALCGLEDTFDMEYNLVDTPLEGCHDMFVHEGSSSLGCDKDSPNPLKHSHVSPMCSQPHFSPIICLICPMIFQNFVILIWIWAMMVTCLM